VEGGLWTHQKGEKDKDGEEEKIITWKKAEDYGETIAKNVNGTSRYWSRFIHLKTRNRNAAGLIQRKSNQVDKEKLTIS